MSDEKPETNRAVVAVFGASGTAGAGAVEACLADARVAEVRAIVRRPLSVSHEKLREIPCENFADLASIAGALKGLDSCLFCLGTSVRNVDGEAQYRLIHVTYALEAARTLASESPDASFVYLSGGSTSRTSRMMWARVKAEAEDQLATMNLVRHANVRPGGIVPVHLTGASRFLLAPLVKAVPRLGIRAVDLGRAMLRLGLDTGWRGSRTLENDALRALVAA